MDDLISRQAAIDAVNNAFDRETVLTRFVRSIAVRAIRDMPPVQPEQKTGQWMEFDDYNTFRCSACGILWTTIEGTPIDNDMNFCPHCGAKMDEKLEEGE